MLDAAHVRCDSYEHGVGLSCPMTPQHRKQEVRSVSLAAWSAVFALSILAWPMRMCLCRTDAFAIGPLSQDVRRIRNDVHRSYR